MTRTMSFKFAKRAVLLAVVSALAVPAAASAMPDLGPGYGKQSTTPSVVVAAGAPSMHPVGQPWPSPSMHRVGQPWPTRSANGGTVPSTRVFHTPAHETAGGSVAEASQGSSFNWTDALIGAAITAAIMTLAIAGSMVARRQGRLQLR